MSEKVQRFVNVLQPGTYVRPHRHLRPDGVNGFEFFVVIQGELGMIILNEHGQILQSFRLSAAGPTRAVELPEGTIARDRSFGCGYRDSGIQGRALRFGG